MQMVQGVGQFSQRKFFVQLRKKADILTVVVMEPFLKTPMAQAKVSKTTETVRWLIPQPKGVAKVGTMLRYLYQFYYGSAFKKQSQGQWRYAKGPKLPIFEFTPRVMGNCWAPGMINSFDGKKGTHQAKVITMSMSC